MMFQIYPFKHNKHLSVPFQGTIYVLCIILVKVEEFTIFYKCHVGAIRPSVPFFPFPPHYLSTLPMVDLSSYSLANL